MPIDAPSYIFSSNNIQEVKQYVMPSQSDDSYSIVLYDFDDTLTKTGSGKASELGGVGWRGDLSKSITVLGNTDSLTPHAATLLKGILTLFIAKTLPAQAVQDETADTVRELEEMGAKGLIFTARGSSGKNAWYKLNVSGVDTFTKEQLTCAGITIHEHPTPLMHPQVFENRMIFAQNGPKEKLLTELFAQKVLDPSKCQQIIFIDDKKDSIEKLAKTVTDLGIPYVGMHYTYIEDLEKQEYDLLRSTIQLINLLATQKLLGPQELDDQAEVKEHGISGEDLFKDVLIQLDQVLAENHIYEEEGLHVDELFNRIQKAASSHFKPADLFVNKIQ